MTTNRAPARHAAQRRTNRSLKRLLFAGLSLLMALAVFVVSVFAWFSLKRVLAAYAPIAKPESLFIGAGHREFDEINGEFADDHFEDIRYLYLNGIDLEEGKEYYDYVFCVFGSVVSGYRLQLAYTTNNQFSYSLFRANESTASSSGAVAYVTHTQTPATYYYSATGAALAGDFLNDRVVSGETLADSSKHTETYGAYANVNQYGEPLYWQTTNVEPANARGDFINYYILRVYVNDKTINDRETDVICIAAKSFSSGA